MSDRIIIAGAGIAGLAMAITLGRRGRPCVVVERRPALPEDGAGIQIGPNGTAMLERLGVLDRLAPMAVTPPSLRVHEGRSGRLVAELPLGAWMLARHGYPYWVLHRRDLAQALLEAATAAGAEIRLGAGLVHVEDSADGCRARLSNDAELVGQGLIAADGVWSDVRRVMFGDASEPLVTTAAARTVIEIERVPDDLRRGVCLWMAPDAHMVSYPIAAGRSLNIVLVGAGRTLDISWSGAVDWDEIARRGKGFGGAAARLLSATEEGGRWRQWPLISRPPLEIYARGAIALIGDAAHPTAPYLAQGAVMALEDTQWMGHCLDAESDVASAFSAYSRARVGRTRRIVEAAKRNGRIYHLDGALARARDAAMALMPKTAIMASYDWLYGYAPQVPLR